MVSSFLICKGGFMQGYCYDIEADNLYLQSTKIWVIVLKALDGSRSLELFPFRESKEETKAKFLEWHNSFGKCPLVVSFNGIEIGRAHV